MYALLTFNCLKKSSPTGQSMLSVCFHRLFNDIMLTVDVTLRRMSWEEVYEWCSGRGGGGTRGLF
jgi:hypothetical protein